MLELGVLLFGVLLIVAALLMLFWDAFQQNKKWGVAGLILLIPLVVHIFSAWNSLTVRKAVYALIIGILAILVSINGGALTHLPFLADHVVVQSLEDAIAPPKETPLPNEEEAQAVEVPDGDDYDPLITGSEFESSDVKDHIPPSTTLVNRTPPAVYRLIVPEDLANAINRQVRLTMENGDVIEGTLTHLSESAATVESHVEGGNLGLSYKLDEIKSVAVRLSAGDQLTVPDQVSDTTDAAVEGMAHSIESEVEGDETSTTKLPAEVEHMRDNIPTQAEDYIKALPATESTDASSEIDSLGEEP